MKYILLILILFFSLFLMSYYHKYLKYKNKYLALKNKNENIIQKLFEENKTFVSITKETTDDFHKNNYAPTYGELTVDGFKKMMNELKDLGLSDEIKFADLGSGLGKMPVMAVHYSNAIKAYGVEFSKERNDKAIQMYQKLPTEYQQKLTYVRGDLFETNISEYNVIFISNLCFGLEMNKKLAEKLKEARVGTFILCSKEMKVPHLKHLKTIQVKMTWTDDSSLKIYQKI